MSAPLETPPGSASIDGSMAQSPKPLDPPQVHSPALSEASILSSESTQKLIKSLSTGAFAPLPGLELPDPVPASDASVAKIDPVTKTEKQAEKKPIKFTVRKVSRDTIAIPDKNATNPPRTEYLYGNMPENRLKAAATRAANTPSQLEMQQAKHDAYTLRIDKIEKEIAFLTNLLPPYNVEVNYATRTKITRAIQKLKMKQDEVQKKRYSLGISISRLWREHDENDIWVRSVSNL